MLANLHRVILCYNDSFHGGVYTCGKKKKNNESSYASDQNKK